MRKLQLPGRTPEGPKLDEQDFQLIKENGVATVKQMAREIVEAKLKEQPENDGNQTPHAGNPVYKAMHACRASSRRDLSRAHRIPAGRDMRNREVDMVVNLLTRWVVREYNFFIEEKRAQQKNLGEYA